MSRTPPRRAGAASLSAAALVAAALALLGCAAQFSELPVIGLPSGAPERPAQQLAYPAVHDLPPARATKPMTNDELKDAAAELKAARDQQPGRPAQTASQKAKKTSTTPRKPPDSTGTPRNP